MGVDVREKRVYKVAKRDRWCVFMRERGRDGM